MPTFIVKDVDGGREHEVGEYCATCWGFPKKCACGGWIHRHFVDENWDDVILSNSQCDQCGDNYEYQEEGA